MDQSGTDEARKQPGKTSARRLALARAWMVSDRTAPEPYLSADLIRHLLIEESGRGRSIESILAMGELGDLPAYRDTSRKTKYGTHPMVFRWSEVRPLLLGGARIGAGAIVRIVPAKKAGNR